jgi:glutathione S-transferase
MSLTLYLHPLSSYCHKALIAFYENAIAFTPEVVNLGDPASRDAFKRIWPLAKFPVLHDSARNQIIPESTAIIEYVAHHFPGPVKLLPDHDWERAAQIRSVDRFYDLHVHYHMQRIVADKLRPADGHDPIGVGESKARLQIALEMAEAQMATREWACGDVFTMADCAAAPPLFFINKMMPLPKHLKSYLERLQKRPSYARVLDEAEPYMQYFPG